MWLVDTKKLRNTITDFHYAHSSLSCSFTTKAEWLGARVPPHDPTPFPSPAHLIPLLRPILPFLRPSAPSLRGSSNNPSMMLEQKPSEQQQLHKVTEQKWAFTKLQLTNLLSEQEYIWPVNNWTNSDCTISIVHQQLSTEQNRQFNSQVTVVSCSSIGPPEPIVVSAQGIEGRGPVSRRREHDRVTLYAVHGRSCNKKAV